MKLMKKKSHSTKHASKSVNTAPKKAPNAPNASKKANRPAGAAALPAKASSTAPPEVRISSAEFTAGAAKPEQIPAVGAPEIAFAGRSNVGKSSLLNMMLARRGLARTSNTPGRTRQINFFDIAVARGPKLSFVDLPGYGYAKVSKSESRSWKELLEAYLEERTTLRAVIVLVDIRRGLEDEERDLVEFLTTRPDLAIIIAATKLDKLARSAQKPALQKLMRQAGVRVIGTSAETGAGRESLWAAILHAAREEGAAAADVDRPAAADLV
jgi:GTP-binding protein